MSIVVQTENFSGPLALLLYLIRREEMDIFDINIHQITTQYMGYIKAMKKLDLELAGDFIAMAATLIQIKSRMLLPNYNEEGDEVDSLDPRKELVQKLLEYQKYQEASQQIYQRPLLGRDLWARGSRLQLDDPSDEEIITEDNALFSLIRSYRVALKSMKSSVHKVTSEMKSIGERIIEMKNKLHIGIRTSFFNLLGEDRSLNHVLVTFLSVLELTRMGFISVFQSENFADIHIESLKEIDGDIVSRVESFEAAETQALAEEINAVNEIEVPEDLDYDDEPEGLHGRELSSEELETKFSEQLVHDLDEDEEFDPLIEAATDEEILAEEARIDADDGKTTKNVSLAKDDASEPAETSKLALGVSLVPAIDAGLEAASTNFSEDHLQDSAYEKAEAEFLSEENDKMTEAHSRSQNINNVDIEVLTENEEEADADAQFLSQMQSDKPPEGEPLV